MKCELPVSKLQVVWLAGWLAAFASAAGSPQTRRASAPAISVIRIGRTEIGTGSTAGSLLAGGARAYVDYREPVVFTLAGPLPRRARLYPLVRRQGEDAWTVQAGAIGPRGNARGTWRAEVQFGRAADTGGKFELIVIAAAEPLPALPFRESTRIASTLAESAPVWVERRRVRPSVGVATIGGERIFGDQEIEVHEMAQVEVVARDLPPEAWAGLVIHPTATDRRWVMLDVVGSDDASDVSQAITAYFGTGERGEDFFRYTVSAFVAWREEMEKLRRPGSGIPPQEWGRYQARFLAESQKVRVIRWEGELRIRAIGRVQVLPDRTLLVGPQEDVHGAVQRQLQAGEKIWIVCIPWQRRALPWIAGRTHRLRPSGQWVVNAAELWPAGKPARFDVVAVLSSQDPTRIKPEALRAWVHDQERPHYSVRVQIVANDGLPLALGGHQ